MSMGRTTLFSMGNNTHNESKVEIICTYLNQSFAYNQFVRLLHLITQRSPHLSK
jgi:hypothetical protein